MGHEAETSKRIEHAQKLISEGIVSAQAINDAIFNLPEFKKWPSSSIAIASTCLAAGFAHSIQLPKDDFLLLCSIAYDMIRAEEKTQ